MSEKFIEYLIQAEKNLHIASHMAYVTVQLIRDKKLLLKILSETHLATLNIINSVLQHDYIYKKIRLTKDAKTNLRIFIEKSAPRYQITEQETKLILELISLAEKHKQSPFEFVKDNKVVILSNNLKTETINLEKLKEFITTTKSILDKVKSNLSEKYKNSVSV